MALNNLQAIQDPETSRRAKITFRSVLLGTATAIALNIYCNYTGMVLVTGALVKSQLPMSVLLPFVAWIGINLILKIVWPQMALSGTELLVIYSMSWIAGVITASGWAIYWAPIVSSPTYYASPENQWAAVLFDVLPWQMMPQTSDEIIRPFYEGLPPEANIPWRAWLVPLYWWVSVSIALVIAGFCISVIFQKQWEEHERLTFPLATFPLALTEGFDGQDRIPTIFRDRLFWIGFWVVFAVYAWNAAGYFAPGLPPIGIYDSVQIADKAIPLADQFPPLFLRILPLVIGLTYLCNLEILLSIWLFRLLAILKEGLMTRVGFTVGYTGQQAQAQDILTLESHGALVFLALWSVWIARDHLKHVWQSVRTGIQSKEGVISYRMALLALALSTLYVIGWLYSLGLSLPLVLFQVALIYIAFFTVTKYTAASGFSYLFPIAIKGGPILESLTGTASLTRQDFVALGLANSYAFFGNFRIPTWPALPHHLKWFSHIKEQRGWLFWIVFLAFTSGLLASFLFVIYLGYHYAGQNLGLAGFQGANINTYNQMVSAILNTDRTVFDPAKATIWVLGGLQAALLALLCTRFAWWPLHPLGLAFQINQGTRYYAFCIFLTWISKRLILRFGGIPLYQRARPFFFGLVVGYVAGVGLASIVDYIWFPDEAHWTHGW